MHLNSQGFRLPKAGNSEADYEDAITIAPAAVAIADGATESSFARAWAQALTEGFACDPLSPSPDLTELLERIGPLQQQWHAGIAWDRLPWFAEDKARNGAFAALLTLRFEEPSEEQEDEEAGTERRWHAFAIGDTCLFQIRDEALHLAFPLAESAAFDSSPLLLSSNPARNLRVWDHAQVLNGSFKPGDMLLLMTDAIAKWFLSEVEAGAQPWRTLGSISSQAEFGDLVAQLRAAHCLKNDDTSFICIQETSVVSSPSECKEPAPLLSPEAEEPLFDPITDEAEAPIRTAEGEQRNGHVHASRMEEEGGVTEEPSVALKEEAV